MASKKKIMVKDKNYHTPLEPSKIDFQLKKGIKDYEDYKGYPIYILPIGTEVTVMLEADAKSTKNIRETEERFFISKQYSQSFKKPEWLPFSENEKGQPLLHEWINYLSENQIKLYKENPTVKGAFKALTPKDTKGVGINYLRNFTTTGQGATLEYHAKDGIKFTIKPKDLGRGYWIEAYNYLPEWKANQEQGVFIVGVNEEPGILNFYGEKRKEDERSLKLKGKTNTVIEGVLEYGAIIDFHIEIHTHGEGAPFSFNRLSILEGGKVIEELDLDYKNFIHTPNRFFTIYTIQEINILPQWIEEIGHKVGEERTFTARLEMLDRREEQHGVLMSQEEREQNEKSYKKLKEEDKVKEIQFTVGYKDAWSVEEDETEWLAQVAQIDEAPLVTQMHEECKYRAIKISDSYKDYYLLKENKIGGLSVNNTTPILEYVAGYNKNKTKITITLEKVDTEVCTNEMGFDNTDTEEGTHTGNVFKVGWDSLDNSEKIEEVVVVAKVKSNKDNDVPKFGEITVVEKKETTKDQVLELSLAYPYEASNKLSFMASYLFGGEPETIPVYIQTCRYIRMPIIKIYPDIEWKLTLKFSNTKPAEYSHTNMPGEGEGSRYAQHQKKALEAAQNRHVLSNSKAIIKSGKVHKWLTGNVQFELKLEYLLDGNINPKSALTASYEKKITRILEVLCKIKDTIDEVCNVNKAKKGKAGLIGATAKKLVNRSIPITFQMDYPSVSITGAWKYGQKNKGVVEKEGSISLGFNPLMKGTGTLDLIAVAEFIPVTGQIIKAVDLVAYVSGLEVWFNLYAFGEVNLNGEILFNQDDVAVLKAETKVGVGLELGTKVAIEPKKISINNQEKTLGGFGAELSAKGETSISIEVKRGYEKQKGPFIELSGGFNGITVLVTGKGNAGPIEVGFENKVYEFAEPVPDIVKKRIYLL